MSTTPQKDTVLDQTKVGDYHNIPAEYHEKLAKNLAIYTLGFLRIPQVEPTKIALYNMKDLRASNKKFAENIAKNVSEITKKPENNMLTYEPDDVFAKKSLLVAVADNEKIAAFVGRDDKSDGGGEWQNSEIGTMYTADEFRNHGLASTGAMILTGEAHAEGAVANMWTNANSLPVAKNLGYEQVSAEQQRTEKIVPDEQIFYEWPEGEEHFAKTGNYPLNEDGGLHWRGDPLMVKFPPNNPSQN
jgi:hypothetical protein